MLFGLASVAHFRFLSSAHWMLQWVLNIYIPIGIATDISVVLPCCLQQVATGVKFLQIYIQVSFQRELIWFPERELRNSQVTQMNANGWYLIKKKNRQGKVIQGVDVALDTCVLEILTRFQNQLCSVQLHCKCTHFSNTKQNSYRMKDWERQMKEERKLDQKLEW